MMRVSQVSSRLGTAIAVRSVSHKAPNGVNVELKTQAFINNEYVDSLSGKTFEVVNPSTEEVICNVSECDKADVDVAVKAARTAFEGSWKKVGGAERGNMMRRLADLLEQNFDELSTIEVLDNGKPYSMIQAADMPLVISHLRYYAGWADKITGDTFNNEGHQFVYTRKEPVGVAGQIVPWNFPMLMAMWKMAPALAAGCTIVLKPAEQTPLGALRMGELIREAGFPAGVINFVPGFGETAGAAISSHMDVDKVSFTGSTPVGRHIMKSAAASNLKKVTLELGGKSPFVVFDDADLELASDLSTQAIYFNQGEVCTAGSRIFVQEGVYDEFMEKAVAKAKHRVNFVGDPFAADTQQGAQVSKEQFDRIMDYIEVGRQEGNIACGGVRKGDKGYFVEPTIITDVKAGDRVVEEEIFGPVVVAQKFTDVEDAIAKSNNTTFGLGAGVISKNVNTCFQMANGIQSGTVWVNTYHQYADYAPFGGYKQSGIGRDKGKDGLDSYLETKCVYMHHD